MVAHGAPHDEPDLERFEVVDVGAGLDRQRLLVRVHEREDPLPQLALDALLDEVTIRVHAVTLFR